MKRDPASFPSQDSRDPNQTSLEDYFDLTVGELREMIEFLIAHRERLRDEELKRLQQESDRLIAKMADLDRRKLLVELQCFKDVLALQKRLIEEDARPLD